MNEFLTIPDDRRRLVCDQTGAQLNMPAATVEKDFWVCWVLEKLFQLPSWGPHLTFKGGTSLSKGWQLIRRFSEDIDIVIDREPLGFGGEDAPDKAPSKKQTKKRLDALRETSQTCVAEQIHPQLVEVIAEDIPAEWQWALVPDPDDPDAQSIQFIYPTAFPDRREYLRQAVKIELGARSDTAPTQDIQIQSYIADAFSGFFKKPDFVVRAVSPVRTFWEKAMLLHEETFRTLDKKQRKARMARHYYDLYCLIRAGIAAEAAKDLELFHEIAHHRQIYFRYTWVDYSTLQPGQLRLMPRDEQMANWRTDYNAMQDDMFFGDVPPFGDLMQVVEEFQEAFNHSR